MKQGNKVIQHFTINQNNYHFEQDEINELVALLKEVTQQLKGVKREVAGLRKELDQYKKTTAIEE